MALVKYNNNSLSSVTAVAGLSSGAMNLITTNTISSGVSSSSFTSSIDSTYDTYIFKLISIHTASDNIDLQFQGSTDSGSNYNTTITSTFFRAQHAEADGSTELAYKTGRDQAQGTAFQTLIGGPGNDNDQSTSGYLYLFSPSSTTFVKYFLWM